MTVVLEYNYGCIHVIRGESNEALCLPDMGNIVYCIVSFVSLRVGPTSNKPDDCIHIYWPESGTQHITSNTIPKPNHLSR